MSRLRSARHAWLSVGKRGALALVLTLALTGGLAGGVSAAYSARAGNASTFATATLAVPGGVNAVLQSDGGTVRVSWSATGSTWATGHRVYRATAPGGPYLLRATFANRTTLSHSEQPGPGTFYYQVRAYYTGSGANWESQGNGRAGPVKPLDRFVFAAIGSQVRGVAFTITMTATASDGTTVTAFTGTVALSSASGTIAPTTSGAFAGGVRSQSVTITALAPNPGMTITATGGSPSCSGTSNAFLLA